MKKVNTNELEELTWSSPKGTFAGSGKQVSEALGRDPKSTDVMLRHPFDVEIARIPPGKRPFPYHSHSHQWEFYHVISGTGYVRHEGGNTPIGPGDAFIFRPGEAHVLANDGNEDLVVYVVADNPFNETCYYPDSNKWTVPLPERHRLRAANREPLEYYDGEEG
jgi:uncharacterized cupin superfamily protein